MVYLTYNGNLKYFEDGLFKSFNAISNAKYSQLYGMKQNIYAFTSEGLLVIIDFETINYKLASEYQIFDFNFDICRADISSCLSNSNYLCLPIEVYNRNSDFYKKKDGKEHKFEREIN